MSRRARAGLTLLELLVGTSVATLIVVLAMQAVRPLSGATLSLRDRARQQAELRLAVDALLADLGGAATALPDAFGRLVITRVQPLAERLGAWTGGDDDGIEWRLEDGQLLRWDRELDRETVVAEGLSAFELLDESGETRILLATGEDADARSVELAWPQ